MDIGQIFSLNFRDGINQVDVGVTIYGYKRKVYNEYLVLELPLEYKDGDTLVMAFQANHFVKRGEESKFET